MRQCLFPLSLDYLDNQMISLYIFAQQLKSCFYLYIQHTLLWGKTLKKKRFFNPIGISLSDIRSPLNIDEIWIPQTIPTILDKIAKIDIDFTPIMIQFSSVCANKIYMLAL